MARHAVPGLHRRQVGLVHLHGGVAQAAQRHRVVFVHMAQQHHVGLVQVRPDVQRHARRVEGHAGVAALHDDLIAVGVLAGFITQIDPHGAEVETFHELSIQ